MTTAFQTDAFQAETVWPDPSDVEIGVLYGPNGDDYEGTNVTGGGLTQQDIAAIRDAVWAKDPATMTPGTIGDWLYRKVLTVGKFLGLK